MTAIGKASHALRLCVLALACLGVGSSWAEPCDDSASACTASAAAISPAALPDVRLPPDAHAHSVQAPETQQTTKPPPPLREIRPWVDPGRRPDAFPDTKTKKRTPPISPFYPQLDHVECDIEGFATKSGQALSDHVRAMTYDCINALFGDAPLELRIAALSMRNMIDLAQATVDIMEVYQGVNAEHLYSKHYLFLRIGYYNYFYHADVMDWGSDLAVVTAAVAEAADAFIQNSHFLDHTETHAETAWELFSMLGGDYFHDYLAGYLPAFKSWINALGREHVEPVELGEVINATNRILDILDIHASPSFVAAATSDPDLVATLRRLALQDYMLGTWYAEVLLGNSGNVLAQFLQYESAPIYPDVVAAVRAILDRYDGGGREIGVWLETAKVVSYQGKCAEFQICGFETELEAQVLSVSHSCLEVDVHIRAEDLTEGELAAACRSLSDVGDRFHALLNTGRRPVANDHNAHLEIVVYSSWDSYDTYSGLFFGNDTDNGGIYYEGDPADVNNLARFFVYVEYDPEKYIRNLEHEYVHYLDGRFNLYGEFTLDYDTLWWIEGLAEYVSLQNENEDAIEIAHNGGFLLNELFSTTYDHSADRVYRWGYLAVRFMFERHPEHVGRIASYLRAGCFAEQDSYLERAIGAMLNDEWLDWLGTVSTASVFTTDRGVTPHAVDCGVDVGPGVDEESGVDEEPSVTRRPPQVELFPLGESTTIDVAAFFKGFGTDAAFSVSSSAPNVVAATLDGSVLTLIAVSAGEAVVSMVASEGDRSVTRTLRVSVTEECPAHVCRSWTHGWRLQVLMDSR